MRPRDTIYARIALLLAAAVLLTQLAGYVAIRQFGRGPAADLLSLALVAQLRPGSARPEPPGAVAFDIVADEPPPSAGSPRIPFDRLLVARLAEKLPDGTQIRVSALPADRTFWVRLPDGAGWQRVSGLGGARRALSVLLTTALFAGLLVLAGAALAARLLTRPLTRLAARAPDLVLGRSQRLPGGPWEVRRLGQALLDTARRRAEAERERELLLAGISHDLRAPLARLRLRTHMLADNTAAAALESDLDELDAVIESFIGYVRDGRDEALQTVDLGEWLHAALKPYRDRHVEFACPPATARIHPLAFQRALVNLVENALVHGRAPVRVGAAMADGLLRIRVDDGGDGMPPDRIEAALKPFETFDRARGHRHTGLGLPTVERIAVQHGGQLHLKNLPGGGLRAEIRVPVDGHDPTQG